jgi:hypothetical protein
MGIFEQPQKMAFLATAISLDPALLREMMQDLCK